MVTEIFSEQLKWFTRQLIEMRVHEVDGFHTSIDFDPALITNSPTDFDTARKTPQWLVIHMLTEIKGVVLKIRPETNPEPSWTLSENGHVEISGYTTELLKMYFEKTFDESSCLFGEEQNHEGSTVLTYLGLPTEISFRGNELAVFRCLKRKFGKDTSFEELYEAIRNVRDFGQGRPNQREGVTKRQITAVQSAVNEVKEKLKMATGYTEFPEIIESVRGIGYKMII